MRLALRFDSAAGKYLTIISWYQPPGTYTLRVSLYRLCLWIESRVLSTKRWTGLSFSSRYISRDFANVCKNVRINVVMSYIFSCTIIVYVYTWISAFLAIVCVIEKNNTVSRVYSSHTLVYNIAALRIFIYSSYIQTCDATYPSSCDGCVLRNGSKSRGG